MKRLALLFVTLFALTAGQLFAQDSTIITLNDSNPSISAVINLPVDSTGVVMLDVTMASVTLTDANGNVVFSSADPRVHHLELSITPNSGTHTLMIERLPGVTQASAQITSQAELTPISAATFVDTNAISLRQQHALRLDAANPAGQVTVDIQPNTTGLITATFPGAVVTSQLADSAGTPIAHSFRDIDSFNVILDSGRYDLNVQADQLARNITAGVSVMPTDTFTLLQTPQMQTMVSNPCTATVNAASINLRSGPGTGYSVLDFGFLGDAFAVGGINPENNWIVIGTNAGSAWMTRDGAMLSGDCTSLQVFDIPLRDAQPAPIIVQPAPGANSGTTSDRYEDDDHFEGGEHEGSEGDD